jgi:MFS transporter, NNP family, nitrate/nitrite transporter
MAGLLAAIFSLPSGVIRALGGWLSDRFGARSVMYWVLGGCAVSCFLLVFPRMDVESAGEGVMAAAKGTVESVSEREIVVSGKRYPLRAGDGPEITDDRTLVWPKVRAWQEPAVRVGDAVVKKQLLARGRTRIHFQANIWIFTFFVFLVGILTGIGKAAVYKHIPDYFPTQVGVVGGLVGVIGGLGGFVGPILFGYLLQWTGLWTTCWMFLFALSVICLAWMHFVIRRMLADRAPHLAQRLESPGAAPLAVPPPAPAMARGPLAAGGSR